MKAPVMPLGTPMQCGKCRKAFAMPPVTKPGANGTPGAAKTRIVTNRPKTMLAPHSQPRYRITCEACRAVMHGRGAPPLGQKLACLKCKKTLVLRAAAKAPAAAKTVRPRLPAPTRPGAPVGRLAPKRAKPTAPAKPAARATAPRSPWWPHLVGLLLTLMLAGIAAAFYYRLGLFAPPPIPETAWKTFTLPGAVGTIDGPGDFVEREVRARGPLVVNPRRFTVNYPNVDPGHVDVVEQFRVRDDSTFLITYSDRRNDVDVPNDFDTVYQQERDYVMEYVKGVLLSEGDVTVPEHTAREFHLDMGKRGQLIGRVIRANGQGNDRIFILIAAGNHLRFVPGDAERFFTSFTPAAP